MADNPTRGSDAAGGRVRNWPLAACRRRRRPNRAAADGDGETADGAAAGDGGETGGGRDSRARDDSHEDRAFPASRDNPASRSPSSGCAAAAGDVVASDGDGVAAVGDDDAVEVAKATDPIPRQARRHCSAMDGLGSNDRPPLD